MMTNSFAVGFQVPAEGRVGWLMIPDIIGRDPCFHRFNRG
tara:strand:- start:2732 stop:2851 length:120 start_codon:yes stop_codon:yes gene_type:complete